jgi:GMP synthase (glutamine-hydrolysing)
VNSNQPKPLIIKTGSSIPALVAQKGDFEDWILAGMGLMRENVHIVDVAKGGKLPNADAITGIVITGSHAMVTERLAWSEYTAHWLRSAVAADVPILGICYGHQLLAHALGGEVGDNPNGREFGTVDVRLHADGDPLLSALPAKVQVHVSHAQSVRKLPRGARVLATTAKDTHAAIAFAPRVWGVQFHPEFDADIVRTYIREFWHILQASDQNPEQRLNTCHETPSGTTLLRRFAQFTASGR